MVSIAIRIMVTNNQGKEKRIEKDIQMGYIKTFIHCPISHTGGSHDILSLMEINLSMRFSVSEKLTDKSK